MEKEKIDILNRDDFVDNVFNVIETLSAKRKSCTFAINGEWGSGKSFVLDMLENKLSTWQNEEKADNQYLVFHYNCWQYDYYNEPLYAIVTAMYDWIKSNDGQFEKHVTNLLLYTLIAFGLTTKEFANGIAEKITLVNFDKVGKEAKKKIDAINNEGKLDDELSTVYESIIFTRNLLDEIAKEQTVVVVVDELDRCLPEYAIKVLERLHHLFDDVENLIVILAVDKEHLNNTVSQIFGFNANSSKDIDSYLAKFIDFEISLDKGIVNGDYTEKYNEYVNRFEVNDSTINVDTYISLLFKNIDSRTRDKIFAKALMIHDMVFEDSVDISVMCVELTWLLYKKIAPGIGTASSSIILPGVLTERQTDFFNFFESEIKEKIAFNRPTNPYGNYTNYYILSSNNKGFRERIVYLLTKSSDFRCEVKWPALETDTEIVYLTKRLEKFEELCDVIK